MSNIIQYPSLPDGIAKKARAIYGKGHIYLAIGDTLDELLSGLIPCEKLFLDHQSGGAYCLYLLITAVQYEEEFPDQRLIEALPLRLDIQYALHIASEHPRISPQSLQEFRGHLLSDPLDLKIFQTLLDRLRERGLFCAKPGKHVGAREVVRIICIASHVERVVDAMFSTLEELAIEEPHWLRGIARPHWYERYNRKKSIPSWPDPEGDWRSLPNEIGCDIRYLLDQVAKSPLGTLKALPEVLELIGAWEELSELVRQEDGSSPGMDWNSPICAPIKE